jgi:hypothetical protein
MMEDCGDISGDRVGLQTSIFQGGCRSEAKGAVDPPDMAGPRQQEQTDTVERDSYAVSICRRRSL